MGSYFLMVVLLSGQGNHKSITEFESLALCENAIKASKVVAPSGAENESTVLLYCTPKRLEWNADTNRYE